MGRLRARLSKTPVDRQVQDKVASAQRAIQDAIALCRDARHRGGVEGARSRRVERDLSKALGALGNVRRLTPIYDTDDPDHMSEDERAQIHREKLEAERLAKEVAEQGLYVTPDEEV